MKNEYIGLRLGIAFSLLIAILVGVGWSGLSRMGRINADLEEIVNKRWAKVQLAREAMNYSSLNNRITMEIFLLKDREEIDPLLVRRAENTERISILVKKIEAQIESEKEKELLAAVNTARWPYVDSYKHALRLLLEEHKPEEAREAMVRVTLPNLIRYHDTYNAFVAFEGDQMDEAARASAKNYAAARQLALTLIVVAVLLATGIAVFVTRSMIREVTQRQHRTRELQRANQELAGEVVERNQAQEALLESEERARLLLDSAAEAIYGINLKGECTFCNRAGLRMLGYREISDVHQENMHQLIHHSRPDGTPYPAEECRIYQAFRRGEDMHIDDEVLWRADGTSFPVELWSYPTRRGGNVVGAVVTFVDISERKRAEIHLRQAKEAAEAANRAKSEFLANMSHEIRTPMNGIVGMTELVLDTQLSGEQRECLNMVRSSADALLAVINDILDFSKIEAGKLDFDAVEFSLRDTLDDTMKTLGLRAHEKQIELVCHVQPDVPDALVGDPGRLRQIVVNLIGNAIKFTQQGEVVMEVGAESQTGDCIDLQFAVTDTGMGIPLDKQRTIFDPFTQVDGSMTRKFGGTGLGLTISSRLVEGMGGRIWVESEPGKGSTFHFTARLGLQKTPVLQPRPAEPANLQELRVPAEPTEKAAEAVLDEVILQIRVERDR